MPPSGHKINLVPNFDLHLNSGFRRNFFLTGLFLASQFLLACAKVNDVVHPASTETPRVFQMPGCLKPREVFFDRILEPFKPITAPLECDNVSRPEDLAIATDLGGAASYSDYNFSTDGNGGYTATLSALKVYSQLPECGAQIMAGAELRAMSFLSILARKPFSEQFGTPDSITNKWEIPVLIARASAAQATMQEMNLGNGACLAESSRLTRNDLDSARQHPTFETVMESDASAPCKLVKLAVPAIDDATILGMFTADQHNKATRFVDTLTGGCP